MAKAYVSYHGVAIGHPKASSVLGRAVYSDVLDFTSAQDTTSSALTEGMAGANFSEMVASISADADCYIAIGTAPDCTLEAETTASSARVFVAAGQSIDLFLPTGAKVAAKAVS